MSKTEDLLKSKWRQILIFHMTLMLLMLELGLLDYPSAQLRPATRALPVLNPTVTILIAGAVIICP